MYIEFHLKSKELNEKLLKLVKKFFKNEEVRFFVEGNDETEHLLSTEANREMLKKSKSEAEKGDVVEVSLDDLLKE